MSGRGGRGRGGRGGRGRGASAAATASRELMQRSAAEAGLDDRHVKVLTDITHPPLFPDFLWHSQGGHWQQSQQQLRGQQRGIKTNNPQPLQQQQQPLGLVKSEPGEEDTSNNDNDEAKPQSDLALALIQRSTGMVYLMNKQREMAAAFAQSAYYVPPTAPPDVTRYRSSSSHSIGSSSLWTSSLQQQQQRRTLVTPDVALRQNWSSNNRKLATDERYFPTELFLQASSSTNPAKKKRGRSSRTMVVVEPVPSDALSDPLLLKKVKREGGGNDDDDDDDDEEKEEEDFGEELGSVEVDPEEEGVDYTANYYDSDVESVGDDGDGEPTF